MRTYTPDEAAGVLRRFASLLESEQRLADLAGDYATDVRTLAVRRADARPTPQAPMIGRTLAVRGGSVLSLGTAHSASGGAVPAGEVAYGAEYGSTLYPQFAPRRASGYFLTPSLEAVGDRPGEAWIDQVMDDAFRGFSVG